MALNNFFGSNNTGRSPNRKAFPLHPFIVRLLVLLSCIWSIFVVGVIRGRHINIAASCDTPGFNGSWNHGQRITVSGRDSVRIFFKLMISRLSLHLAGTLSSWSQCSFGMKRVSCRAWMRFSTALYLVTWSPGTLCSCISNVTGPLIIFTSSSTQGAFWQREFYPPWLSSQNLLTIAQYISRFCLFLLSLGLLPALSKRLTPF
jgi:hypothetical protein